MVPTIIQIILEMLIYHQTLVVYHIFDGSDAEVKTNSYVPNFASSTSYYQCKF